MTSIISEPFNVARAIVTGDLKADPLAIGVPAQTETLPEQLTGGRVLIWAQPNMSRTPSDREMLSYTTALSENFTVMAFE